MLKMEFKKRQKHRTKENRNAHVSKKRIRKKKRVEHITDEKENGKKICFISDEIKSQYRITNGKKNNIIYKYSN